MGQAPAANTSTQDSSGNWDTSAGVVPAYQIYPWSSAWGCAEWISWYNSLLASNNQAYADATWQKAWLDGVSNAGGGNGIAPGADYVFDSVPLSCRTLDSNFQNFLNSNPNLKGTVFSGIAGEVIKPVATVTEGISHVENIISNTGTAAENTSTVLKKIAPYVVVLLIVLVLLWASKKYGLIKLGT